jgi:hypothetical protein
MAIKVGGTTVVDDSLNICNAANVNATVVNATTFCGSGACLTGLDIGSKFCYGESITQGDFVALNVTSNRLYKVSGSLCTEFDFGVSTAWYGNGSCNSSTGLTSDGAAPFIISSDGTSAVYGAIFLSNCCCPEVSTRYTLNMSRAYLPNWCTTGLCSFNPNSCCVCNCANVFGFFQCDRKLQPYYSTFDFSSCKLFTLFCYCSCCCCLVSRGSLVCFSNTCPNANILGTSLQTTACTFSNADRSGPLNSHFTNGCWLMRLETFSGGVGNHPFALNVRPSCLTSGTNWCLGTTAIINGDGTPGSGSFAQLTLASCGNYVWNPNQSVHGYIPVITLPCCAPGSAGGGWNCAAVCYCHAQGDIFTLQPLNDTMQCVCKSCNYRVCTTAGNFANVTTETNSNVYYRGLDKVFYIGYDCAQDNTIFIYHDTATACQTSNARISFYCACTNGCFAFKCREFPAGASTTTGWEAICCTLTYKCLDESNSLTCTTCCMPITDLLCHGKHHCSSSVCWSQSRPICSTCNTFPVGVCGDGIASFVPCNGNLCNIQHCTVSGYLCCSFGGAGSPDVYGAGAGTNKPINCSNVTVMLCMCCTFTNAGLLPVPHNISCICEMAVASITNNACFIGLAASTAAANACCRVYLPSEVTPDIYCCLTPGTVFQPTCGYCHHSAIRVPSTATNCFLGTTGCTACQRLPITASNTRVYIRT